MVKRFRWDGPQPTTGSQGNVESSAQRPATQGQTADAQPTDPTERALAFIANLPRLPGDMETLSALAAGTEVPKQLSAAALAHLAGDVPAELVPDEAPAAPAPLDPASAKKLRLRGQVAGLTFLIVGLGFAGWVGESAARDAEAQHWKSVPGRVSVCKTELVSREPDRYEHHFAYRYKAGGVWHTGRRVRFAGGQGNPVGEHRVDEKIKVYVDPHNPKISVLKPGVIGWAWAQLIAGLVIAALGGLYLRFGGRHRQEA
ncbi:MAG: DUF3592 domain-containing protein [Myxococcales bacterium]|nr:DUF3592 domain-containing protein [Myxococcales bacterium]